MLHLVKKRTNMKWLEIIEVRSAGNRRKLIDSQLEHLINETGQNTRETTTKVYKLATVETDFSIHLLHDSAEVEHDGSPIGQRLAFTLKEFGIVNHQILIEIHEE